MIDDPVIITAIFTGIISVLGLTFKNIKSSHCWSKDNCCDCTNMNSRSASVIISNQPSRVIESTHI